MFDDHSDTDDYRLTRRKSLAALGTGVGTLAGVGAFSGTAVAWDRFDVCFDGCQEVSMIVSESDIDLGGSNDSPAVANVIVASDGEVVCRPVEFTAANATTVPAQFGDAPVVKYTVPAGEKILGVLEYNYSPDDRFDDPVRCVNANQNACVTECEDDLDLFDALCVPAEIDVCPASTVCPDGDDGPPNREDSDGEILIDSFEDGNLCEYSNNPADWAINSTFATDGTEGLEYSGDTLTADTLSDEPESGLSSSIVSETGLNAYPSQGDEFHIDHEYSFGGAAADTLTMRFFFGFQGPANLYYVQMQYNADRVTLVKGDGFSFNGGNGFNQLLDVPLSAIPENTDLRLEITWDDGTLGGSTGDITLEVFDASTETSLGSGTTNDTKYTSGGIGMRGRLYDTNHRISQDDWRIV